METSKLDRIYNAYRSSLFNGGPLKIYFDLISDIIVENKMIEINETKIASLFRERYNFSIDTSFLRLVLDVGVREHSIQYDKTQGIYFAKINLLKKNKGDFSTKWQELKENFIYFCNKNTLDIKKCEDLGRDILDFLDSLDISDTSSQSTKNHQNKTKLYFASFIQEISKKNHPSFNFILELVASNMMMQALFYQFTNKSSLDNHNNKNIMVYLDTPVIFALLGMDHKERTASYTSIIKNMINQGIKTFIFKHNLDEVQSIILGASRWVERSDFDLSKSNEATNFFMRNGYSKQDVLDFSTRLESKIKDDFEIMIDDAEYYKAEDIFQEDEDAILDIIKKIYENHGASISIEQEASIKIDVRSISMLYRKRKGQKPSSIFEASYLMITKNQALSQASQKYDFSNKGITSESQSYIPVCITIDLFGSVLWLTSNNDNIEYYRQNLLADCYDLLKPNQSEINDYISRLKEARASKSVTEREFSALATNTIVIEMLQRIYKGDYSIFDNRTPLEVIAEIKELGKQEATEEVNKAKEESMEYQQKNEILKKENDFLTQKTKKIERFVYNFSSIVIYIIFSPLILLLFFFAYFIEQKLIVAINNIIFNYQSPIFSETIFCLFLLLMFFLSTKKKYHIKINNLRKKATVWLTKKILSFFG